MEGKTALSNGSPWNKAEYAEQPANQPLTFEDAKAEIERALVKCEELTKQMHASMTHVAAKLEKAAISDDQKIQLLTSYIIGVKNIGDKVRLGLIKS